MKKKIIVVLLISVILLSILIINVNAAFTYNREGGTLISNIATTITDNTWIDAKYKTESLPVTSSNVHVYDYNTTTPKQMVTTEDVTYNDANKSRYGVTTGWGAVTANSALFQADSTLIYYSVKFENGEHEYNDVATFVYDNALKYNNQLYNVKLNIKSMKFKSSENIIGLKVLLGSKQRETDKTGDEQSKNIADYTRQEVYPFIEAWGKQLNTTDDQMEIELEYFIVDSQGNETPISGVFGVEDIDYNQGVYIDGIKPNNQGSQKATNVLIKNDNDSSNDEIMYKTSDTGTYIYSSTHENRNDDYHDVYVLVDEKSKVPLTYTFDKIAAGSPICFIDEELKFYKKVITEVINGEITESKYDITDGDNRIINYSPNANCYLKSITVDGTELTPEQLVTFKDSYTFSNITEDHTIKVEYAEKLKVMFDAKGGSPTPDTQYVDMNGTATKPNDPTKTGYTFDKWLDPSENPYDFTTPVTQDILLTATWNPINYNLKYELNGGTRHPDNVDKTFTVEDVINFATPTREGYDFGGWYSDPNLTTPKTGINHEAADVTVYAKWTPIAPTEAAYKVEHYKETTNGEYQLVDADTENKTGTVGEEVTATPKTYTGYVENTTHQSRKATGEVAADGSLVLKLYYDIIKYTVSFDPKGGTPDPDDQTVKYNDTATEPNNPTKPGYTFDKWLDPSQNPYDFTTPVTEDILLTATWNPINYNLKYELNGGTRHPDNIDKTFTVEDVINFATPTREGYNFEGWYSDPNLTTRKDGISHETGDVTVYAKWTPIPPTNAAYKVEHYKETTNGNYELVDTENKSGTIGEEVTATSKSYTGYVENIAHQSRKATGEVAADGSLVLKLYYDKNKYTITFDPKGGTPDPDDQTVKYNDTATEPNDPTKSGYTFDGWYYIDGQNEVKYDFNTPVTKNIDLIAKWTPIKTTPKEDDTTITPKKEDKTVARTVLPNTGKKMLFSIFGIIGITAIIGKKYFSLRDIKK